VLLPFIRTLALKLFGAVVAILAIIAAADYLFQYRLWFERQKMSLREIKDEFKRSDGDPQITPVPSMRPSKLTRRCRPSITRRSPR
jgi:flagellar biosynthesis protein FlhB